LFGVGVWSLLNSVEFGLGRPEQDWFPISAWEPRLGCSGFLSVSCEAEPLGFGSKAVAWEPAVKSEGLNTFCFVIPAFHAFHGLL